MKTIPEALPLRKIKMKVLDWWKWKGRKFSTYSPTWSPKREIPKKVCNTPLTTEETIWDTGEVTLILKKPATEIENQDLSI